MNLKTTPPVSICVLTYGDYARLARRCIGSIRRHCPRDQYRLIVGANAVGEDTHKYLSRLADQGHIDITHISESNINKCPMMRRMFADIDTEFIWWFDDDSYIVHPQAFERRLEIASSSPPTTVGWGYQMCSEAKDFNLGLDVVEMVRRAPWYRGKPPPSRAPEEKGAGNKYWTYLTGGGWFMRASAIRAMDWPDPRLVMQAEDVFLGEAIRQQGWNTMNVRYLGVELNTEPTRGTGKDRATLARMLRPLATMSQTQANGPDIARDPATR